MGATRRRKPAWQPVMGQLVSLATRSGSGQRTVKLVADACGGYVIVEGTDVDGRMIRYPVKPSSLSPLQPMLFDDPGA